MNTTKSITVSAPGKIHFLGEHVVVHGKPALIAAINKRCKVALTPRNDKKIQIISKNFDKKVILTFDEVLKKRSVAERSWKVFLESGDVSKLTSITKEVLDYAVIAVGETLQYYSSSVARYRPEPGVVEKNGSQLTSFARTVKSGFTLTIDSDIPVGSGNGSSAAIAVTIAAAVSLFLGENIDKQKIYDIAFATEQKKHGRPSGGDPAVVLHGGLVWFRKETQNLKIIESVLFTFSKKIARNFSMIDTGKPEESTGEMIATVKEFMVTNPSAKDVFDDQERLTRELLDAIKNEEEKQIMDIIQQGERNLETMGVVSPFVKKLIRKIEKSGGAAKISGGGGKTKGTGMLLVYHPSSKKLDNIVKSLNLSFYSIQLGVEGLLIE